MNQPIWARLAFFSGLAAAVAMLLQGPAYRLGWWDLGFVFSKGFPAVVYLAGATVVLTVLALVVKFRSRQGSMALVVLGLVLAGVGASVPMGMRHQARQVPPIHDISTDLVDPPAFVAVVPLREGVNPATYDGEEVATQQREAYPDVQTIRVRSDVGTVFEAAMDVVARMGWEVHASDAATGRIEATEHTAWFGFADDIVIRIRAGNAVTDVDVRSKSRVGRSDLGVNAKRIRAFKQALLGDLLES